MRWNPFSKKDGRIRAKPPEEVEEIVSKSAITRLKNSKMRMLRDRLERLQRKEEERALMEDIEDIEQDLYGDDEPQDTEKAGSLEEMAMALLAPQLQKGLPNTSGTPPDLVNLSDEELIQLKDKIPKEHLKAISKLPKGLKIHQIRGAFPDLDEATVLRAAELV